MWHDNVDLPSTAPDAGPRAGWTALAPLGEPFSPGFTNSRSALTALAEDLASHGYAALLPPSTFRGEQRESEGAA